MQFSISGCLKRDRGSQKHIRGLKAQVVSELSNLETHKCFLKSCTGYFFLSLFCYYLHLSLLPSVASGIALQRFRVTHQCVPLAFVAVSRFLYFLGLVLHLAQTNRLTSEPQTHNLSHPACTQPGFHSEIQESHFGLFPLA